MIKMPITLLAVSSAAIWDLKVSRIPNLITFPAIALGLLINSFYAGFHGFGSALAGTVAGIFLLLIPFALGGMGAGDVKLLAAIGALNGTQFAFYTFLYSAIAGGAIALVVILIRGQLFQVISNLMWIFRNLSVYIFNRGERPEPVTSGIRFPYGAALLLGTVTAYLLR